MKFASFIHNAIAVAFVSAGLLAQTGAGAVQISAVGAAGINNDGGAGGNGTHFHWGPGTEAQVNYSFGEEGRGVAEFDLSSLGAPVGSAQLSFRVSGYQDFYYAPTPFEGNIDLFGYAGDNNIQESDFESPSIGGIGSFNAAGVVLNQVLTFDIKNLVNARLGQSIGILWDPTSDSPEFSAMTFGDPIITIGDGNNGVPEPGTLALLGLSLAGLAAARRRKQ